MNTLREILPVILKREGTSFVAFFPTLPGTNEFDCTCYARIGQRGSADINYARSRRPASSEDAAGLLSELRGIYETGEDAVNLKIVRRFTSKHFEARKAALR